MYHNTNIAEIIALADGINARMEDDPNPAPANTDPAGGSGDYPEGLGDAGKAAIDRMKAERNQAKTDLAALRAELDQLKAKNTPAEVKTPQTPEQKDEPKSPDQIRDEVTSQITADNNKRILRSDVRRLATDFSDPNDALRYLDLSDLTPDAHGDFDEAAIKAKLDQLLKDRAYLAKREVKFQGGADSGALGDTGAKPQLTREDIKKMDPLAVNKARLEGQLTDILSGKK